MEKTILDACCGGRMFYFNKNDERVIYGDIRSERHITKDKSSRDGRREIIIDPDFIFDFRALPFEDNSYHLVIFDPPHLKGAGETGWMAKKYGCLTNNWREDIKQGFSECFRVLRPNGTMIFKWNEESIKVSEILKLTPEQPIFGNRFGKTAKSHWIVFMK